MMNATEFFFAAVAVFGATSIIYGWYSWIYGLDDSYQESIGKRKRSKKQRVVKVVREQQEKKQAKGDVL